MSFFAMVVDGFIQVLAAFVVFLLMLGFGGGVLFCLGWFGLRIW